MKNVNLDKANIIHVHVAGIMRMFDIPIRVSRIVNLVAFIRMHHSSCHVERYV